MSIAQMLSGRKIFLPPPQKRSAVGNRAANREEAKIRGARSNPWSLLAPNWWGNAGISRPYPQFILGEPIKTYRQLVDFYHKADMEGLLNLQEASVDATRAHLKGIFGSGTVMFDANGSCLISTLSKGFRKKERGFESVTFTDQGRLVYAALGFEAGSIIEFRQNFEQQLGLFDHPYPDVKIVADEGMRKSVHAVDIFTSGHEPKSDERILDDFETVLKVNPDIGIILLLHVSRTGRVLPVEKLARIARKMKKGVPVFVDGCQAIGRLPFGEMQEAYQATDGYIVVGHKALGAMIGAAAILKQGVEERLKGAIENGFLAYRKLFQFESMGMNEAVIRHSQEGKCQYMVSAPEIVSLRLAMEACDKDFAARQSVVAAASKELVLFFQGFPQIRMLFSKSSHVQDIIPFVFEPKEMAWKVKDALKLCSPPIAVAPITRIGAMRVAIDPKLPNFNSALEKFKEKFAEAIKRAQ